MSVEHDSRVRGASEQQIDDFRFAGRTHAIPGDTFRITRAKGKDRLRIALVMPASPYLVDDLAYPPMGLLYLAAAVREWRPQHEVEIIELGGDIDWREKAKTIDADIVGVQCVSPNHNVVKELVQILDPDSLKVLGGIHPTFVPSSVFELGFDTGIMGEGEHAFIELLDDITNDKWKPLYQGAPVEDLDALPMPALDLVDLHKYRPGGEKAISIYSSRGCQFKCTYCSMINGKVHYAHSVDRVAAEVKRARDEYGVTHFVFGDDNIGINLKRLKALLEKLKPLGCTYRLNMSVGYISEAVAEAAAEAGVTTISYGVETFSPAMLRLMLKPANLKSNLDAVRITQSFGMKASIYLIVNYPGETEDTVDENLEYFVQASPDIWLLSQFVPLPGSETWARPEKFGILELSDNWDNYFLVGNDCSFKPAFRTEYLTHEKQMELHDRLFQGLQAHCPMDSKISNPRNREKLEHEFTFFDLPTPSSI